MAATTLSRGWSPSGQRLLISTPNSGDNALELARGLSFGFESLQMPTSIVDGAAAEVRSATTEPLAAKSGSRPSKNPKRTPHRDSLPQRAQAVADRISRASGGSRVVVIVAPPLADGPDALLMAEWASECLLVVREGHTTRSSAAEALRLLTSAGIAVRGILFATGE